MVDLLVSGKVFVDILKGLLAFGDHRPESAVDRIVEPLFNGIKNVVDDYLFIIYEAIEELDKTPEIASTSVLKIVTRHRIEMLTKRLEIRALIEELLIDGRYKGLVPFLNKLERVFWVVDREIMPNKMSRSTHAVYLLEAMAEGTITRREARDALSKSVRDLEDAFAAIAQSYARQRVQTRLRLLRLGSEGAK